MELNIKKITVLTSKHSTDIVLILTDMPSPYPKVSSEPLILEFKAEAGEGVNYVLNNFGRIPDEVIST